MPELHTIEARQAVAEVLLALLRRWALPEAMRAKLLAMDDIALLQRGALLPERRETLERAGLILAIDRSLQRFFADDRVLRCARAG